MAREDGDWIDFGVLLDLAYKSDPEIAKQLCKELYACLDEQQKFFDALLFPKRSRKN